MDKLGEREFVTYGIELVRVALGSASMLIIGEAHPVVNQNAGF